MIQLIDYQIDILKILFVFYLLIFSAQIHNIFTSLNIKILTKNIVLQYILIFLVFFFLVSSISNTKKLRDIEPIQKLIYSIFYFILFILTLKINGILRNIIFILLIICYFLDMNHDHYFNLLKNKNNTNKYYWITWKYPKINMYPVKMSQLSILTQINTYIIYTIFILFIIGIIPFITKFLFKKNKFKY
jgi:hypothetical protein